MTEHGKIPIPEVGDKHLPNQSFWAWLKTETALFISQIVTTLGMVLYVASFSYYVFGHDQNSHHKSFEEYLQTANQVIFYSNIAVCILFIIMFIYILHKNDHGEFHVQKAFKRVFGEEKKKEENLEENIEKAKSFQIIFKKWLISYWCYAILYYLLLLVKLPEYLEKINWQKWEIDSVFINFNTLGALILFISYMVLKFSNPKGDNNKKFKNYISLAIFFFIVLFIITAWGLEHYSDQNIYSDISTIANAISGVIDMIAIAMLISLLDSKLIGIPSLLITLIYGYAILQPLMPLFENHPAIESIAYFLVFIFKIYFTIVVIYILQTGRLLNYLVCNEELRYRVNKKRNNTTRFSTWILLEIKKWQLAIIFFITIGFIVLFFIAFNFFLFYSCLISVFVIIYLIFYLKRKFQDSEDNLRPAVKIIYESIFFNYEKSIPEGQVSNNRDSKYEHSQNRLKKFSKNFRRFWWALLGLYLVLSIELTCKILETKGDIKRLSFNDFVNKSENEVDAINASRLILKTNHYGTSRPGSINDKVSSVAVLKKFIETKIDTVADANYSTYVLITNSSPSLPSKNDILDTGSNSIKNYDTLSFSFLTIKDSDSVSTSIKIVADRVFKQAVSELKLIIDSAKPKTRDPKPRDTIDLTKINKIEKTKIIDALIENKCLDSIVIQSKVSALSDVRLPDEKISSKLDDVFDTELEVDSITKKIYFDKISQDIRKPSVLLLDSDYFAYVYPKIMAPRNGNRNFYYEYDNRINTNKKNKIWINLLEFALNNLSIFFLFLCFVAAIVVPIERDSFEEEKNKFEVSFKKTRNYGLFIFIFLLTIYASVGFYFFNVNRLDYLENTITIFNAISGLTNGLVFCMLIGRLDSILIGIRNLLIFLIFLYPAIQPLFVTFADGSIVLMNIAIAASFFFKLYLFALIVYIIKTHRLFTYFYCIPELNKRINSIYANQFEIIIKKDFHRLQYTFEIRNENKLAFTTDFLDSRENVIHLIEKFQSHHQNLPLEINQNAGTVSGQLPLTNNLGTNWLEIDFKVAGSDLCHIRSKEIKHIDELKIFRAEACEKLPYCKVSFA